jgi:flavorubredoxin
VEEGEVELIASSGAPAAQGLPDATKCEIGGQMNILGRTFSFIDPPLADRSHTTWIYDHNAQVLFTADGFGNRHRLGECSYTSAEFRDGIPREDIYEFHKQELVWLRYVDPDKLQAALHSIFENYSIEYVAPIHGNPIAANDVSDYLDDIIVAADRISNEYTVPGSGQ